MYIFRIISIYLELYQTITHHQILISELFQKAISVYTAKYNDQPNFLPINFYFLVHYDMHQ